MAHATILLDPNWNESGGGGRGAQNHYALAKSHELPRIILGSGVWDPAPDAHVYCWTTKNYLHNGDAHRLLWALGVRPITHFVWVKTRGDGADEDATTKGGIGQYGRGAHEVLIFGCMMGGRGTVYRSDRRDIRDVFFAPLAKHSAKPPESYDLIEARSLCPSGMTRLEMFARSSRPGWAAWGDEAPTEQSPPSPEPATDDDDWL